MVYDLIRNYLQDKEINSAHHKVDTVWDRNSELKSELDRLTLVVESLWDIIKKQNNLTDKDLLDTLYRLDLKDGRLDAKNARTEQSMCDNCGRVLQVGLSACMYCGKAHNKSPFVT